MMAKVGGVIQKSKYGTQGHVEKQADKLEDDGRDGKKLL